MVYGPLATALVEASPGPWAGCRVLDVGSGTGMVADAAEARGATVVAADLAVGMLRHQHVLRRRRDPRPAVAADALALPFADAAFDVSVAGFLLNHLPPGPALAELGRVVRPGGLVVATTWPHGRRDAVKAAVDSVLAARGWRPPAWYAALKADVEPVSGRPRRLAAAARGAGLIAPRVVERVEDLGLRDPAAIVAYRLALPHVAPWVDRLAPPARAGLERDARDAVAPHLARWRPAMLILVAHVAGQPRRRAAKRSSPSA